jgi:hypothetical protein
MAQQGAGENKDLLTRLADAGEDAIQKLGEMPGGRRAVEAITGMRDRIDELQRRVRGLDELEKRVADLEAKVGSSEKPAPRKRTTTRKPRATPRTPTQKEN